MVIVAPGVAGEFAVAGRGFGVALPVVHAEDDDRARAGEDLLGVHAAFLVALHPGHLTGVAGIEPLAEFRRMRRRTAWGDAAGVEAEGAGARNEGGLDFRGWD